MEETLNANQVTIKSVGSNMENQSKKYYDSLKEYEWSIMRRDDDPDPMEEYEFNIMHHED